MISSNDKRRLLALLPDFALFSGIADAASVGENGAVIAANASDVLAAAGQGLGNRQIFFLPHSAGEAAAVLGKCRLVAESMEDLRAINEAAGAAGVTTMVGLRLTAEDFRGSAMTTAQLRGLVHDIKQLRNVSVCGCMVTGAVEGLHGKALGQYVRSSYRTAKAMTYILPCTMPYIVIEGLLDAMAENEAAHPEDLEEFITAANIVGMQNATAFYADYYVM